VSNPYMMYDVSKKSKKAKGEASQKIKKIIREKNKNMLSRFAVLNRSILNRTIRCASTATSGSSSSSNEYRFGLGASDVAEADERVRRALDLSNASNAEILQHKIDKAVGTFQRFEGDTGSSEVQVAVLTERINNLTLHMRKNKKDFHSRHGLDKMVSKRRKLMAHLRKQDFETYKRVLHHYGLRDIIRQLAENQTRQGKRKFRFRGRR